MIGSLIKSQKIEEAEKIIAQLQSSIYSFGNQRYIVLFENNKGLIDYALRKYKDASEKFTVALHKAKKITDNYSVALILKNRGEAYFELKEYIKSKTDLEESKNILTKNYSAQKQMIIEVEDILKQIRNDLERN